MLRYAFGSALVVAVIFAFLSNDIAQHKWSILLIAAATYSLVTTGYLLYEVTRPQSNLGDINHEKSSIGLALVVVFVYLLVEITVAFSLLSADSSEKNTGPLTETPPEDWIYRDWGAGDNCTILTTITKGPASRELTISSGPARDVRQIVGNPTPNQVQTNAGVFVRHPDGSMTSSEAGMEGRKLIPCGK